MLSIKQEHHEYEIPEQVLIDILSVYEFGRPKDLLLYPNNYIFYNSKLWTSWIEIFKIRARIKTILKLKGK